MNSNSRIRKGLLQHRGKFAFLLVDEPGGRDVFVRGPSLRLAMSGDFVEVRCRNSHGRPDGEIVRVLRYARDSLVGELRSVGDKWWLADPAQEESPWAEIESFEGIVPKVGTLAAGRITRRPTLKAPAACVITELIGRPGDPGVRTRAILRGLGIPEKFPQTVTAEARRFPYEVTEDMWQGRMDLRDLPICTIDGADAKDFDDAVSLERLGGGTVRLGVHIADVSHYVEPESALDKEARERGTSVYLPGRVIPMLPPHLSDNLCSLVPDVERLAFSCFMDIDPAGVVKASNFAKSVIRSWRRFTYEEVETLLEGGRVESVHPRILKTIHDMGRLAKLLTARRLKRGALDIDLPEYKIEVDAGGAPTSIVRRERLGSHRLIEECMILANEAVASFLLAKGKVFPNRIHEDPDPEKLAALQEDVRSLGVSLGGNLASSGNFGVQGLLKKIQGHPLHDVIGVMVMRSLKQAVYSPRPIGHFGLASKAYCHFTSPIRRYPDLVTHRVLEDALSDRSHPKKRKGRGRGRKGNIRNQSSGMEGMCAHASTRERAAVDAERQVLSVLRAEWMSKRVGQEFSGTVVRSSSAGVFVDIDGTGVHGLARGAKTRIGTKVRVFVKGVHEGQGDIHLSILGASGEAAAPPERERGSHRLSRRRNEERNFRSAGKKRDKNRGKRKDKKRGKKRNKKRPKRLGET